MSRRPPMSALMYCCPSRWLSVWLSTFSPRHASGPGLSYQDRFISRFNREPASGFEPLTGGLQIRHHRSAAVAQCCWHHYFPHFTHHHCRFGWLVLSQVVVSVVVEMLRKHGLHFRSEHLLARQAWSGVRVISNCRMSLAWEAGHPSVSLDARWPAFKRYSETLLTPHTRIVTSEAYQSVDATVPSVKALTASHSPDSSRTRS